jgi:hypothetical protein
LLRPCRLLVVEVKAAAEGRDALYDERSGVGAVRAGLAYVAALVTLAMGPTAVADEDTGDGLLRRAGVAAVGALDGELLEAGHQAAPLSRAKISCSSGGRSLSFVERIRPFIEWPPK